MLTATSTNQQIVNARILAEMAVQFNIGADILGKGNRFIEKHLGAEKMSGDTVMVPVIDSGRVFEKLDLSGEDLSVQRDAVPVTVRAMSTAAQLDQDTITLSIKDPAVMGKRVAKLAMQANNKAYDCLSGNSLNAVVIAATDITQNNGVSGRNKFYDAFALCDGSKLDGETFGVCNPLVWAKLIAMFQTNYAPNSKEGSDLYRNELGPLGGLTWTKSNQLKQFTAATITATVALAYTGGFGQGDIQAPEAVPSYGLPTVTVAGGSSATVDNFFVDKTVGALSQPFSLAGVYSTDIFGESTGRLAVFHFVADMVSGGAVTAAHLAGPVFFEGPRKNVTSANYNATTHSLPAANVQNILVNGTTYLAPAVIWKRDDFLVAVKGLEKFYGMDSLTIPTQYRDKGILPLRGLAWTDPEKAATIFRVDVLLGMAAYSRTSMCAIYIAA
jgi:hypothetical protein